MDDWTLFEADDREVHHWPVPGGEVSALSVRAPHKDLNEDAAAVLPCGDALVLLLCDGMGGHQAGERASRTAIETVSGRLAAMTEGEEPRHALLDGIEAANRAVLDLGVGAGATLAAVLVREGHARSLHVGDSVAVHLGQRGLIKAETLAHSLTSYAVEAGLIDEEEALHHADRHVVTNALGTEAMRIEVGPSVVVARRDTLLLASDGLCDNLRQEEIVELARKGDPSRAVARLAELAYARMVKPEDGQPSKPDDLTLLLFRRTS